METGATAWLGIVICEGIVLFSGDKLRLALSSDLNGNNFITGQNEAQKQGDNLDYFFLSFLFYISLKL